MKNLLSVVLYLLFFFLIIYSCKKDASQGRFSLFTPESCGDTISFQHEIVPQIINVSCNVSNCHNSSMAGGLIYSNHAEISANTHPMYLALIHDPSTSSVHLNQTMLNDSLLQKFYCWIQQGRLNN